MKSALLIMLAVLIVSVGVYVLLLLQLGVATDLGAIRIVTLPAVGLAALFLLSKWITSIGVARNAAAALARQSAAVPAISDGGALLRNWSVKPVARPLAIAVTTPFTIWGPARIEGRPRTNRILIVDDDPQVIQVTHRMLTRNGYSSEMALGGHEGMARLATGDFGVVIVDYYCGGGDAPALVREARRRNSSTYIILTSSAPDLPLLGHQTGADHLIAKPYDLPELSDAVARALAESGPR
jgi:CheY-like chemotaxis protein